MEGRELRSLLMDRCVWRVALPVLLALAVTFGALALWTARRDPGEAAALSAKTGPDAYASLQVANVSPAFAAGGGDTFYFFADGQGYLYIAVLSDRQYASLREALRTDGPGAEMAGMTVSTPEGLRRLACEYFGDVPYDSFADYFGPAYLDCTRTPCDAPYRLFSVLTLACALSAIGAFCLWLRRLLTVGGCLQRLRAVGSEADALAELSAAEPAQLLGPLAVTEHYVCSARRGLVFRQEDLREREVAVGRFRARFSARTYLGRRRTLARLPAAALPALRRLLDGPERAPELTAGAFARPDYWEIPGGGR